MKISCKVIALLSVSVLFLASESFALPMAGDNITISNGDIGTYSVTTKDGTIYHSFCLESAAGLSNNTYKINSIGDTAFGGGTTRDVYGNYTLIQNGFGDKVEAETKWLYAAYLTDKSKATSNEQVQKAIWWLEEEIGGVESSWTALQTSYDWEHTKNNYTGWDVVAVNLSQTARDTDSQSQLIGSAPVPEPATMLLFGIGLASLAGVQRRRKK